MKYLALLLTLLFSTSVFADDLNIRHSEPQVPGEIFYVTVRDNDTVGSFRWEVWFDGVPDTEDGKAKLIDDAVQFLIDEGYVVAPPTLEEERIYMPFDGGETIVLPSVAGIHYIIFVAGVDSDGEVCTGSVEYRMPGDRPEPEPEPQPEPQPEPEPEPQPEPEPEPQPAPDLTGLAKWVYEHSMRTNAGDSETANDIADVYETMASQAAALNNMSAQDLINLTAGTLRFKLTQEQKDDWQVWVDGLEVHLSGLNLTTKDEHVDAWNDIVEGLRHVR